MIAIAYSGSISVVPLLVAFGLFGCILSSAPSDIHFGAVYFVLGTAVWVAFYKSGVDPVVAGLDGRPDRARVSRRSGATSSARPTSSASSASSRPASSPARRASALRTAVSPNERLQSLWHPWTSYVIVPLFALANAGIHLERRLPLDRVHVPVTLGILFGYVLGKPVGIVGATWLATASAAAACARRSAGRRSPARGRSPGSASRSRILIADLAFHGAELDEAKVGVLSAALLAATLTWSLVLVTKRLPRRLRIRVLLGTPDLIVDLADPVDPERDHIRGPLDAPVTVLEYGDFECPYCGQAEPVVRELLREHGDVGYVWRHLPLNDVHPNAQRAAEAAEAAAEQGAFWEMHDLLLERQDALGYRDLVGYARELGLDVERFQDDLRTRTGAGHIAQDVDSADLSGVSGTPTFFINGLRHYGAYDIATLSAAVKAARARELVRPTA